MRETIVLLHGLGRTSASMMPIALAARARGYRVINWRYLSTRRSIRASAARFAREIAPRILNAPRVHFITHSLGGIIVRQFLAAYDVPNAGHVVMLAPPNGGSEVADVLQHTALRHLFRPIMELGTNETSVPRTLPPPRVPVGVIAGSRSHIPLFSHWMHDVPNDGVVPVERTRVPNMRDFLVVHHTHTFLPWSRLAIRQALTFIERGTFAR
jgi:pimeloyl-ACP methyl ester carboxylesterase